jgi:hypothetical protein
MQKKDIGVYDPTCDPLVALNMKAVIDYYQDDFFELLGIIVKHDPMGLSWCSSDEYSPETKTIITQLVEGMSEDIIHELVYLEFFRWFQSEELIGPWSNYKGLAHDIYVWMNKD